MKKVFKFLTIFFIVFSLFIPFFDVNAYVSVKGYYRKDGTYVQPHVRSNPNGLKTDNYGYTPSQGTTNKTYGTRGTEWDTPTSITDPDYYEGKALYESGSAGTGSSDSTESVDYKNISTASCSAGSTLFRGRCYKIPANAHAINSLTDAWWCDAGYVEVGNYCILKEILSPGYTNTTKDSNVTSCSAGSTLFRGRCYKIPANAHAINSLTDAWWCDAGYVEVGNYCILK